MRKQRIVTVGLVFLIIFCWPLGFSLLFYRLYTNKSPVTYEDGSALITAGCGLALAGLIFFLMWMKNVPLFLICCLLCAAMLYAGQRAKSKGKKFHRYALVLENFGTAPICDIAAAMGLSYEEAQADLSAMIDKGYIEKAYIDQKTKRFVFVGGKQTAKETAGRQKRVVCEGCGAAAVVNIGRHSLCDYCNSPLDTT